jgi:virginiamycin B lyase
LNKKLWLSVTVAAVSLAALFGIRGGQDTAIAGTSYRTAPIPGTPSRSQSSSPASSGTNSFTGLVKGADGKKLNGVFVSAKREQDIYTTTVYSDDSGQFRFPALEAGTYTITAHTPGFRASQHTAKIVSNGRTQPLDFTLQIEDRPAVLVEQATPGEWLNSMPGTEKQKYAISNMCGNCHHNVTQIKERRFTQQDWRIIVEAMSHLDVIGEKPLNPAGPAGIYFSGIWGNKDEVAEYLGQIRGPDSPLPKIKFYPRPTGKATRAVITEYRIPRDNAIPHDVQLDAQGNVWYNDFKTDWLGKLDPHTGEIKEFKLPSKPGRHPGSADMFISEDDNVWINQRMEDGRTLRFDTKTEKITGTWDNTRFVLLDLRKGIAAGIGMEMDIATGQVTHYKYSSSIEGYGDARDSKGIGYRGGLPDPDIKVLDHETGKVTSYMPQTPNSGPRRIALDGDDYLWFGEWFGGKIGRFDIKEKKITEYPVNEKFAAFYEAGVDPKNHTGWAYDWRNDREDRVDPLTGEVTEYPMPTLDVEARRTAVDTSTDPPSVWINGAGIGTIIRIQAPR